jgi:hypothetical protein
MNVKIKAKLVLLSLIFLFIACKSNHEPISDDYSPIFTDNQILDKLERYYKTNSSDSLLILIQDWNNLINPNSKEYSEQNDTIKNIYQLFNDMYKPFSFGEFYPNSEYYLENEFFIIQNNIEYAVVSDKILRSLVAIVEANFSDTLYHKYKTNVLRNFRPNLKFNKSSYLYLTEEYESAINRFLGTGHTEVGDDNIMNTAYPKGETLKRYNFLSKYLYIVHGHWGGYWHIETFPIIYKIIFNDRFNNALVDFRFEIGGTAIQYKLIKKQGKWVDNGNDMVKCIRE